MLRTIHLIAVICIATLTTLLNPVDATVTPSPGYVLVLNGLTPTAEGCEGTVQMKYGLLLVDEEWSFMAEPDEDCDVAVSVQQPTVAGQINRVTGAIGYVHYERLELVWSGAGEFHMSNLNTCPMGAASAFATNYVETYPSAGSPGVSHETIDGECWASYSMQWVDPPSNWNPPLYSGDAVATPFIKVMLSRSGSPDCIVEAGYWSGSISQCDVLSITRNVEDIGNLEYSVPSTLGTISSNTNAQLPVNT